MSYLSGAIIINEVILASCLYYGARLIDLMDICWMFFSAKSLLLHFNAEGKWKVEGQQKCTLTLQLTDKLNKWWRISELLDSVFDQDF